MHEIHCQACANKLTHTLVDLGMSPLCETYIAPDKLDREEVFYPLHIYVCDQCFLVQIREYVAPSDIYEQYPYFSSYSDSWLAHAKRYCDAITERFELSTDAFVVEIASNDGYLLRNFVDKKIPCLGVEPAANVAKSAISAGIDTAVMFFGEQNARKLVQVHGQADLLIGNNVLAHVPNLNDFVAGLKVMLKAQASSPWSSPIFKN